MRLNIPASLICCVLVSLAACQKRQGLQAPTAEDQGAAHSDVCDLLTNEEIQAVQGSPITDRKSSGNSDGGLRTSECFYATKESSKSVSLAVTQRDPASTTSRTGKDFWEETFGRFERDGKEQSESRPEQKHGEGEEEATPPKKITGLGDEAFWAGNRVGGALYVLKKDAFIRLSVGGPGDEKDKIEKSKALAEKALARM